MRKPGGRPSARQKVASSSVQPSTILALAGHRMGLFNRNRTSVGLDIGSGLIKLAVVSHGSGEPVLSKVAMSRVVDDAIVEGEVMDPGIVAEAIKQLFADVGIKPKNVITAVGGRDVIIKKIPMDRMKEHDARELIRWEA